MALICCVHLLSPVSVEHLDRDVNGSGQMTKIEYDALNRPVRVAQVIPGTSP